MGEASRKRAVENYSFRAVMGQYRELWLEMSDLAHNLKRDLPPASFEDPHYCRTFAHYPTYFLEPDTPLRITPAGEEARRSGLNMLLAPEIAAAECLNMKLLKRALSELGRCGANNGPLTGRNGMTLALLRDILVAESRRHKDYVSRQIMWLIKQGLAKPVIEDVSALFLEEEMRGNEAGC